MAAVADKDRRKSSKHGETRQKSEERDTKRIKHEDGDRDRKHHVQDERSLFYAEEEESVERDPQHDLELCRRACDEIRKDMKEIKSLKASGDKTAMAEVAENRIHGSLQFLVLRKLNRLAHLRCGKAREATGEARNKIDQYNLQLQNLLYEANHLQKEINKCLEFRSKDEELELVSVEEMYRSAPEEISKPDVTIDNPHEQRKAQLDWELEQRKRLLTQLEEARRDKEDTAKAVKTKQEHLSSLRPKLMVALQATRPVQDFLGLHIDDTIEQHATARYLPEPLYILYRQTSAYAVACKDSTICVRVEGDAEAARASQASQLEEDEDSDSDQEESEQRKSKHRRKTVSSKTESRLDQATKRHPLFVELKLHCAESSLLTIQFFYITALGIVTVKATFERGSQAAGSSSEAVCAGDLLTADAMLHSLYPNDVGSESPNPANVFELSKLGLTSFADLVPALGRPYVWAQKLAGLRFLSPAPAASASAAATAAAAGRAAAAEQPRQQLQLSLHQSTSLVTAVDGASCVEDTLRRMRRRVRARLSLHVQLNALERGVLAPSPQLVSLFPSKPTAASLRRWTRGTTADMQGVPHMAELFSCGALCTDDLVFVASVQRGPVKLTAHVVVSPSYPHVAPYFSVAVGNDAASMHTRLNDENVKAMEAEVNVHYGELTASKGSHDALLTNQLMRLLMCFDVYVETEATKSAAFAGGDDAISCDKISLRKHRGPDRLMPFVYDNRVGLFVQR